MTYDEFQDFMKEEQGEDQSLEKKESVKDIFEYLAVNSDKLSFIGFC